MTLPLFPHRESAPEAPPRQDNRKALVLAVLAHLLLLLALIAGVNWHSATPGPVQVELWANGNSPVAPLPPAKLQPEPPQPAPKPPPEPVLPPPTPVQTSEPTPPDIALEEARKKREQEQKEREAAEAAKQKARLEAERKQAQLQEAQRLEDQRRAAEKRAAEDAAQKAAAEKAAAEKAAAEKKAKEEAAKKAAADKALRDAFRNDALDAAGIAGGTADRNQAGGGRDDGYGAKIRACVQPGVAYPPPPRSGSANPTAQYRVQLNAHGQVMGIALMRSSGIPGFDRAVETGIRRCDPFPKPTTGRYEPIIDVVYRMYD